MAMAEQTDPVRFAGYEPGALQFLADLAEHNERAWFGAHKMDYERLIKVPTEALCAALAERFAARGLPLLADPARSPFRIYRDVRFSRDKSPYKTAQGAQFPWQGATAAGRTSVGVGGYFHLEPGEIFVGGGMWHPDRAVLAVFRDRVDRDPGSVLAAIEDERFQATFGSVTGESLARNPRGYAADHPHGELLRLKDVIFSRRLSDADVCTPELPDRIAADLDAARPVLHLLASLAPGANDAE